MCKKFKFNLNVFLICALICSAMVLSPGDSFSQSKLPAEKKKVPKNGFPVIMKKDNDNFSRTPENNFSKKELAIMERMNQIKQPENTNQEGDKLVELQKSLEETHGSTLTKNESSPIGNVIMPGPHTDNVSSNVIFNGDYNVAIASQVEQRGPSAGKVWLAVGHSNLDTGIGAKPDTIALYYTVDGGATYTEYVRIAFSSANKMGFDDLDMEIIENSTGTKYIYLVFGYYTNGYFGQRLIGYITVSTPTLGVFGSTLSFPGQTPSSRFFNARIASDNVRYPLNPYVNISVMQDSISGGNHYVLTKFCRILSPYALNPAITYFSKSIYAPTEGFYDFSVTTDIADYHNGSDTLVFLLSGYPGFNDKMYFYKAFGNNSVYPVSSGFLSPTGDNMEYARIASNGGTNQKKLMITFTDDYANLGDYDQWALTTYDANNWNADPLEYNSYHQSRYGDIIGRRDASGSFAVAFMNSFGNLNNVTTCRINGDFSLDSYLHCTNTNYANSVANPKPSFRYVDGDSCLNFWSYFYTMYSTSGCSGINFYLKTAAEGYYNDSTGVSPIYDVFQVILAEAAPPHNFVDTALVYFDYQLFENEFVFPHAADGSYYFVLKHRNALETWSAAPISISHSFNGFYDFTTSSSKAYGNNLTHKGALWCVYSGDVNSNGAINLDDIIETFNDVQTFIYGTYLNTDLNGDNYVNLGDLLIVYNNAVHFVTTMTPP